MILFYPLLSLSTPSPGTPSAVLDELGRENVYGTATSLALCVCTPTRPEKGTAYMAKTSTHLATTAGILHMRKTSRITLHSYWFLRPQDSRRNIASDAVQSSTVKI